MLKLPTFLVKSRHGIYYLRLNRNGRDTRKSLRTKDEKTAIAAAFSFGNQIMNNKNYSSYVIIKSDDGGISIKTDGTQRDHDNAMEALRATALVTPPNTTPLPGRSHPPVSTYTIQDCVDAYFSDREHEISENTKATYATSFKRLIQGFESKLNIQHVTADTFIEWRKATLDLNMHPKSQNRDLNAFHAFFEWCISRQRYIGSNPIVKPQFSKKIKSELTKKFSEPIAPFNKQDLIKIFTDLEKRTKPCAFWMPLIALYTGMRISEISELKLEHVINYDENKYALDIKDGKTDSSIRAVPLHPDVINIGFSDYLKDIHRLFPDTEYLFPHLIPAAKNGRANQPGKDFSQLKINVLKLDKEKVFHSFRSTLISCLQKNGMQAEFRKKIVGHDSSTKHDTQDVHLKHYSKAEYDLHELETIFFPKIDYQAALRFTLPKIKYVAEMFDAKLNALNKNRTNSALRKARATSKTRRNNKV